MISIDKIIVPRSEEIEIGVIEREVIHDNWQSC